MNYGLDPSNYSPLRAPVVYEDPTVAMEHRAFLFTLIHYFRMLHRKG